MGNDKKKEESRGKTIIRGRPKSNKDPLLDFEEDNRKGGLNERRKENQRKNGSDRT